ncbi:hypothetical protein POX_f07393 [Penicillium oxalicum]|nr:hypothetical protein POX_f07393 [Penicillium oxalicum]KAI2787038.1 hypothetical protein POX_f07393 [Penicillium oxalicum]
MKPLFVLHPSYNGRPSPSLVMKTHKAYRALCAIGSLWKRASYEMEVQQD